MKRPTVRSRAFPSERILASVTAIALTLAATPIAFAAGEPDLKANAINAPNIAEEGSDFVINVAFENIGGALRPGEQVTFDVYMSQDFVIDANDPHCGTFVTSTIGFQNIMIHVPEGTPAALYTWAMRIQPAAGELNLANNFVFGLPVGILHIDMCLLSGSPTIDVTTFVTGPSPAPIPFTIGNCGSFESILIYAASETPSVPWLDVTPATNFAVAQVTPASSQLVFDTSTLPLGDYSTTVKFVSITNPNEFITFDVTLHVTEAYFKPGDRLIGEIATPNEIDEVRFHGIAGERVKLSVVTATGDVKPLISLLDEQGTVLKSYKMKHSLKPKKKTLKLPSSGLFRLRLTGQTGTFGSYDIKTSRKLPKAANKAKKVLKSKDGSGFAAQPVLCLPDAVLNLVAKKGKTFTGPLGVAILNPNGGAVDINPFMTSEPDGSLSLANFAVNQNGKYVVVLAGFVTKKDKVQLFLNPVQPPPGNQILFIP